MKFFERIVFGKIFDPYSFYHLHLDSENNSQCGGKTNSPIILGYYSFCKKIISKIIF